MSEELKPQGWRVVNKAGDVICWLPDYDADRVTTITALTKRAEEAERLSQAWELCNSRQAVCLTSCAAKLGECGPELLDRIPLAIDAIKARAKAAERRAYELAVAIMGGEDALGYADSIETDVLTAQLRDERSKQNAWTDAVVKVATEAVERRLAEAERVIAPFADLASGYDQAFYSDEDVVNRYRFVPSVGTLRAARKWQEEGR